MSSQIKNTAQKILTEIFKYHTVPPATNPPLPQDSGLNIPQGIPALFAYSQLHGNDHSPDKTVVKAFLLHQAGNLLSLRLVVMACGLIYLSRPIIGPVLSSVWDELGHDRHELLNGDPLPNNETMTKAKLELEPKSATKDEPKPNPDLNTDPEPEPRTVSITIAELKELNDLADATQARLDAAQRLQEDMLTANCDLNDDVERLEDEVERVRKQAQDDAAHSDARIRALSDQIDIEKDARDTVWKERENFRLGGKELKKRLEDLQAEFNILEDDRDECQDEREKLAAEIAKALSDAAATGQAQDKRIEDLESQKDKEVADATTALTALKTQMEDLKKAYEILSIDSQAQKSAAVADEEAMKEYQDICEDLEQEVTQQKKDLQVAEDEKASLRAEIAALKERLEAQDKEKSGAKDGGRQDEDEDDASNDDGGKDQGRDDDDDAADDDADDGRNGGGEKVADGVDDNGAQGNHGATDTPPSSEGPSTAQSLGSQSGPPKPHTARSLTSSCAPPATEPSPSTASSPPAESTPLAKSSSPPKDSSTRTITTVLNAVAPEFKPSTGPKSAVPRMLPTHQAYFASLVGIVPPTPGSSAAVLADSPIESAQEPGEPGPTYSPAPKAAGPGEAKNAHIRKLNEDVMKKAWRRQSGMPDTDEEIILAPEDEREIEGMFQRQIIQAYTQIVALPAFPPSYSDIVNAPEMTSVRRTTSAPAAGIFAQERDEKEDEDAHASGQEQLAGTYPENCPDYADADSEHEETHSSSSGSASELHRRRATTSRYPAEEKPTGTRSGSAPASRFSGQNTASSEVADEKDAEPSRSIGEQQANSAGGSATAPDVASEEDVPQSETPRGRAAAREPSGPGSSKESEAEEDDENDGDWSDVEDDDHREEEEKDDGAPMLGNYKVTRGHTNEQEDDGMPMLGRYKVTRGPKPTEDNSKKPMLGSYNGTRGEGPTSSESGMPKAVEESVANGGWTDVEEEEESEEDEEDGEGQKEDQNEGEENEKDGKEEEDEKDDQEGVNAPLPVPQSQPPTRELPLSAAGAIDASSPAARGHRSDRPNPEATRDEQPANRPPSSIFPGIENATKTHDEAVGDAFADYFREHGTKKLEDSMWADKKPDAKAKAIPQRASSTPAEGVASPRTPIGLGNGGMTRAPPRGPPNFSHLPKPQPPPGAPTGPRGHASRHHGPERSHSGIQTSVGLDDPDTTPRVRLPVSPSCGSDNLPPRPMASQAQSSPVNAATRTCTQGELDDGTQDARALLPPLKPIYRGSPLRNVVGAAPSEKNDGDVQPATVASPAGTPAGSASWSPRGHGRGGRGGLGARGAHTPQKRNPTHGPTADTSKATPTDPDAQDDFKILGASRRGGQEGRGAAGNGNRSSSGFGVRGRGAGQATPTPQPGPARGSRSAYTARSSFQRWQDRMAEAAGAEAETKQR